MGYLGTIFRTDLKLGAMLLKATLPRSIKDEKIAKTVVQTKDKPLSIQEIREELRRMGLPETIYPLEFVAEPFPSEFKKPTNVKSSRPGAKKS